MPKQRRKRKGGHGGKRPGAGRKPEIAEGGGSTGIFVRLSAEQKQALVDHVAGINEGREARGQKPVYLSTWLRELALKHSGNEELGLAAQRRREAEEAKIV